MHRKKITLTIIIFTTLFALASVASADGKKPGKKGKDPGVQLGPRPYYLVEDMDEGELKTELEQCSEGPFEKTEFSIGHRGAALQFPEHTRESYVAAARVKPKNVFAQSFNLDDVLYWINNERKFGRQAVFLDGRFRDPNFDHTDPNTWSPSMQELISVGVKIIAPPMWMLMALDGNKKIVPSTYANGARTAGLDIITWTLERSGLLKNGGGFYYRTVTGEINNDGDAYVALDVLAQDVGILGIFSDWPATVTYYANCKGLK
ncbi:MAG: hypothetical protein JRD84_03270 [Deltaproteobacteria bacterium]|nr:hypothetical protein [Deltaproteobacteria bacterium]